MTKKLFNNKKLLSNTSKVIIAAAIATGAIITIPKPAQAQVDMARKPVLVITNKAMPSSQPAPSTIYTSPRKVPEITPQQITASPYIDQANTVVGEKIRLLNKDLFALESRIGRLSDRVQTIEQRGRNMSAGYYASVATINTQLQTGTTPGNPRLVGKLNTAQKSLETLSKNVADLNSLSVESADIASKAAYLLDTVRSTYHLSGGVEEDHVKLAQMEDKVNASVVNIGRIQNNIHDDLSRTTSYLTSERENLRTLALAVSNGDLYGQNLSTKTFMPHGSGGASLHHNASFGGQAQAIAPSAAPRQQMLAKIRFDKANVQYEQPIYAAVQNALNKYPGSRFEIVAVHPTSGNTAQIAIESTKARRNAEKVLRTLTQMGIPPEKVDLSYNASAEAHTNEVHLILR